MKVAILVERNAEGTYCASNVALGIHFEATTRDAAIAGFHHLVDEKLGAGGEVFLLELDQDKDALIPVAGVSRADSSEADEVVFLVPTNLTRPFFASLLQHCETRIDHVFCDRLRTIVRYVSREALDAEAAVRLLLREFYFSQRIRMVIIVPTESEDLCRDVASVISQCD
jgi:hypothetical protein